VVADVFEVVVEFFEVGVDGRWRFYVVYGVCRSFLLSML